MKLRTILFFAMVIFMAAIIGQAIAASSTDESVMGNDRWSVQSDGDIVPGTDSAYDFGASGTEVANAYVDTLYVTSVDPHTVVADSGTAPSSTLYIKSASTAAGDIVGIVMRAPSTNKCSHVRLLSETGPFQYLNVTCP